MSDFDGEEATPRSKLPGSCSLEPVTNAEARLSSSVFCARFGAGLAQSLLPAVFTAVLPSPPSNLLGLTVTAANAPWAAMASSASAATKDASSVRRSDEYE